MEQESFIVAGKKDLVYKLHKNLYGFKQSPRCWNKLLTELGFKGVSPIHILKLEGGIWTYILIYVEDMLIASENGKILSILKIYINTVKNSKIPSLMKNIPKTYQITG